MPLFVPIVVMMIGEECISCRASPRASFRGRPDAHSHRCQRARFAHRRMHLSRPLDCRDRPTVAINGRDRPAVATPDLREQPIRVRAVYPSMRKKLVILATSLSIAETEQYFSSESLMA